MQIRSGVLKWKDHIRWSDWIVFTNWLGDQDQPEKYALPEMLDNYNQTPVYNQPAPELLDLVELNSNGVTGVKHETHLWVYHLEHLVWYAVPKVFAEQIKTAYNNTANKEKYILRTSALEMPDLLASSTGVHEPSSEGWNGQGQLEFFVEKYSTDTIRVLDHTIPRPERFLPQYNGEVFAVNYKDSSSILLPYNQLITVPYRELNGSMHWIPIVCGAFYEFGRTNNKLDAPVTYTGWAAFRCQTGSWKLARNDRLTNYSNKPDCFFAITTLELPSTSIDTYQITGYWALHTTGIFYEVDRESYIRIQQASQTCNDKTYFFRPDTSILANYSCVDNNNVFAIDGMEVMTAKVQNTGDTTIAKADWSQPASFQRVPDSDLIQIWDPGLRMWKTSVKDLLVTGNFKEQLMPFSIIGMQIAVVVQQLLEILPTLVENLKSGNDIYAKMKEELAGYNLKNSLYTTSTHSTEEKIQMNLDTLQSHIKQVEEIIEYYNTTRYTILDLEKIRVTGTKVQEWLHLGPEILQDIKTQAIVIVSIYQIGVEIDKGERHGIIAKIQSSLNEMQALVSQVSTGNTQASLHVAKAEELKVKSRRIRKKRLGDINKMFNAIKYSYSTLSNTMETSTGLLSEANNLASNLESKDLETLKGLLAAVDTKQHALLDLEDTIASVAIAINMCLNQLEQLINKELELQAKEQQFSLTRVLSRSLQYLWIVISSVFIGIVHLIFFPFLLFLRIFIGFTHL